MAPQFAGEWFFGAGSGFLRPAPGARFRAGLANPSSAILSGVMPPPGWRAGTSHPGPGLKRRHRGVRACSYHGRVRTWGVPPDKAQSICKRRGAGRGCDTLNAAAPNGAGPGLPAGMYRRPIPMTRRAFGPQAILRFGKMSHTISRTRTGKPMRLFEENYLLLRALVPQMIHGERVALDSGGGRRDLDVEVVECARYTTTLHLRKRFARNDGVAVPDLSMKVRAYHDAAVAEVLAYQGCDRIPPSYLARGNNRYQTDEKQQINEFLNQLLHYCLSGDYLVLEPS